MTEIAHTELKLTRKFDPQRSRHFLNGVQSVLHCHHYATLYSQLADDAEIVDGKKLLRESAEQACLAPLVSYYAGHGIESVEDRIAIGEAYYSAMGLGVLKVTGLGCAAGRAELTRSHVDEGWKKKWGEKNTPINFITQGYVAALFSAVLGLPAGTFTVTETQSIVSGAEKSVFSAVRV